MRLIVFILTSRSTILCRGTKKIMGIIRVSVKLSTEDGAQLKRAVIIFSFAASWAP